MKVFELIELLSKCDPNADVFVMSQRHYPFECWLDGVARRSDWLENDDAPEPSHDDLVAAGRGRWTASERSLPRGDVFLLEGGQHRYGTKQAWDNAR